MFQSLLSWISRFGTAALACVSLPTVCFNPCCLGLAVLAAIIGCGVRRTFGFQSLLSWISRFGYIIGSLASSQSEFQSLLSWISRFG